MRPPKDPPPPPNDPPEWLPPELEEWLLAEWLPPPVRARARDAAPIAANAPAPALRSARFN